MEKVRALTILVIIETILLAILLGMVYLDQHNDDPEVQSRMSDRLSDLSLETVESGLDPLNNGTLPVIVMGDDQLSKVIGSTELTFQVDNGWAGFVLVFGCEVDNGPVWMGNVTVFDPMDYNQGSSGGGWVDSYSASGQIFLRDQLFLISNSDDHWSGTWTLVISDFSATVPLYVMITPIFQLEG